MSKALRLIAAAVAGLSSLAAHAAVLPPGSPNSVPEPGTWALVGLAAAVGLVVSRKRRK